MAIYALSLQSQMLSIVETWKITLNRIHKRALKLVYNDIPNLSFDGFLVEDKLVNIHLRNFNYLTLKFPKSKMELLLINKRVFPIR